MKFAVVFIFVFAAVVAQVAYAKRHPAKHELVHEEQEFEDIEDVEWPQIDAGAVRSFGVPEQFAGRTHHEEAEIATRPNDRHHQKSSQKKMTTHHYYN